MAGVSGSQVSLCVVVGLFEAAEDTDDAVQSSVTNALRTISSNIAADVLNQGIAFMKESAVRISLFPFAMVC